MPESTTMVEVSDISVRFKFSWEKPWKLTELVKRKIQRVFRPQSTRYHNALTDVSFRAYQGDIIGVIGPNGSGKSTLLRTISGIYTPDSGHVACRGRVSTLLALGTGFDNNLNGIDNVVLNGLLAGMKLNEIKSKLSTILEFADIGEHVYKPMKYYSNGMIARLGFSVVLAMEPDILLIDEVFSVGDLAFQHKSERVMHELFQKTACQIIVTHNLQLVRDHCNRVLYLRGGRIVQDGLPADVVSAYQRDYLQE